MLKPRLITAVLLASIFILSLYQLSDLLWALLLLAFILVGAWEWGGMAEFSTRGRAWFSASLLLLGLLLLPGIAVLAPLHRWGGMLLLAASSLFWLLLAPVWLAKRWRLDHSGAAALTGVLLLLPPWLALVELRQFGPQAVLGVMLTVAVADSAAYFSGKRFGRHKLAPAISPGKTWEGLAGGLLAVLVLAAGLCLHWQWNPWLVMGFLAIVILSVMGDLFESLIKRQAGLKDSGSLLPGHGGVLDRIDGLTSTLPLVAFLVPFYLDRVSF